MANGNKTDGRYTRIKSRFWADEKTRTWDDQTRYLALYVLTSPHNNILGCYVLPKLYICEDLNWSLEQLSKPFAKLLEDGFIKYDELNRLVLVVNYLKHNPIENKNQAIGAGKQLRELPRSLLLQDLEQLLKRLNKPFLEPLLEQIPKPVTVTVTVTASVDNTCMPSGTRQYSDTPAENSSGNPTGTDEGAQFEANSAEAGNGTEYSVEFEEFWQVYPRRKEKAAAFSCWKSRLKEGHLAADIITAAQRYAKECVDKGTEISYIKQAKTFLGPKKPFLDYLDENILKQERGKLNVGSRGKAMEDEQGQDRASERIALREAQCQSVTRISGSSS